MNSIAVKASFRDSRLFDQLMSRTRVEHGSSPRAVETQPKETQRGSTIDREIERHLDTLEALFFFAQSLESNTQRLTAVRSNFRTVTRNERLQLRDELRQEVRWLRDELGAIAKDHEYVELLKTIRSYPGYYYLDKLYIDDHWFTKYETVFPRWKHVKDHAAVIFDGQTDRPMYQLFELEEQYLRDARRLLQLSEEAQRGIDDFRKREPQYQRDVLMYSRTAVITTCNFIEAYLHGLAYDCFHLHHDELPLEDHDLLAEWDSVKKRRRPGEFRQKVFRYPVVIARAWGRKLDLSGCTPAHFLVDAAKDIRDALVHPSPFVDANSGQHQKVLLVAGAGTKIAAQLLTAAIAYADHVEKGLGNDPSLTAPWLCRGTI